MSDMDTVCKQRFDNKLSLICENKQNTSWKEVWKSKEDVTTGENCSFENGKSIDESLRHVTGTTEDVATSSSNASDEAELIETTENNHDNKSTTETALLGSSPSAIEIEDEACTDNVTDVTDIISIDNGVEPFVINDGELQKLLSNQSQNDTSVRVCDILSCSYFGKPDPLISIEKVDHDSSFESVYETGNSPKQDEYSDIILESDQNMHDGDDDDVTEAPHNSSDIEVEYDKERSQHFQHGFNSSSGFVKDHKHKSHSKKADSCDVVQISSSEDEDDEDDMDEDDDDDDESVHSLFAHSKEEQQPPKKVELQPDHVCSMITMDVMEMNISAMKAGPIACFPNHGCVFFKELDTQVSHEGDRVIREVMVHGSSLESFQWVAMFGGLVLEITLNMTNCHDTLMTFFQVPHIKVARCYPRFPPILLRIYFESRHVGLSLKHNFQQFLNSNLFSRNASWSEDKGRQLYDIFQSDGGCVPIGDIGTSQKSRERRRAHPYQRQRMVRKCRASSRAKFSYYRPLKWPYRARVDAFARKNEFIKGKINDPVVSGYNALRPYHNNGNNNGHWVMGHQAAQNYYQAQHGYYGQPYMGLDAFDMGHHSQQPPNMSIVTSSHHHQHHHHQQQQHLQSNQWFNRVHRDQSPVYVTSGFQGSITKLFTYKPPNSKGGINVTNEDLFCLNDGEYLNDVIIDFYLKYLMEEVATAEDKRRTHVFSSFFYGHLMSGNAIDSASDLTAEEQRHAKVKTWTRNVDIFSKDFVIVPINESYHWFLAVICFPNVREISKYKSYNNLKKADSQTFGDPSTSAPESMPSETRKVHARGCLETSQLDQSMCDDATNHSRVDSSKDASIVDADPVKKLETNAQEECMDVDTMPDQSDAGATAVGVASSSTSLVLVKSESSPANEVTSATSQLSPVGNEMPDESAKDISMKDDDKNVSSFEDDIMMEINSEVDDDPPSDQQDLPTTSGLNDGVANQHESDDSKREEKEEVDISKEDEINPRNPCILIFDSLKGESRYDVANVLRQYLQVEWDIKKRATEGERVFDQTTMKGSMVTCPQQPNSSDCGIYVLQFVESFFTDPIKDFTLPLWLADWFTSKVAMSKRYQLAKLVMKLKDELSPTLDYDPLHDGCFNIAPILSDDDDDDDDDEVDDDDGDIYREVDDDDDDDIRLEKKEEEDMKDNEKDDTDHKNIAGDDDDTLKEVRREGLSPSLACADLTETDICDTIVEETSTSDERKS